MKNYTVYSDPVEINNQMLVDIENAKECVYLETYIFDKDALGDKYKAVLIKKAKQGVKVNVLFDSFGSSANKKYFKDLTDAGGEIRVFRELAHTLEIVTNHERDHRKLLLVDHSITYIGSANISKECQNWRECVLRLKGSLTKSFEKYFIQMWHSHDKLSKKKIKHTLHKYYEIVEDFPSKWRSPSKKMYVALIKRAKSEILIETAYFIPPKKLRKALYSAVRRGVDVKVVIPFVSDVWLVDTIRNLYLEKLHKRGVNIFYYKPKIMHSKVMVVDSNYFLIGSSNLTYRAFVFNYELNLSGSNKSIALCLRRHITETLKDSEQFSYESWKKRSLFKKVIERILAVTKNWV